MVAGPTIGGVACPRALGPHFGVLTWPCSFFAALQPLGMLCMHSVSSNVNEFVNIEFLNTRSSNENAESEHVCLYLPFV